MKLQIALASLALLASAPATAQDKPPVDPPKMLVEIYRVAPGKHEEFMRMIALFDEANRRAGLPPRQLYVHQDGASWDFMFIQPADTPEGKSQALADAYKALNTPSGPDFFVKFRAFIEEHTDTFVSGPTNAADWLKKLDAARAGNR